ncbi:MAG: transcription elongation factor GreA [Bifidobacteriaceae bacterium]|nr:transcription elongation factor GreA [Bifidobacteriaceae bacterium]
MAETTWLTQEAYDRLKGELHTLETDGRTEVVKRIEAARSEGDLRENGGYHAAREEQAKMEGRIAQLKALLTHAKVGEAPESSGQVAPGTVVTARVAGEPMVFLVGSREVAATTDLSVFSEKSPMGAAILGAAPGEERHYTAPNGREVKVKIDKVEPFTL